MIKKVALVLILAISPLALTLISKSYASQFDEGKHYTKISDKAPSVTPKLTEFFSFYCHNCYAFEMQYMPRLKPLLNKNIHFETKHVEFQSNELSTEVMRALVVIQEVAKHAPEKRAEMSKAMFSAIQGNNANTHSNDHKYASKINGRNDIKKLFMKFGISIWQYDNLADSEQSNNKLKLWRKQQHEFGVKSIPAFVVNDKYMVNLNNIRTLGEMIELINFLSTKQF